MRNTIVLACYLLLAVPATSQSFEIEKIKDEINNHPQEDTFRVNRLNEFGKSIEGLPISEREKVANEALAISRKIKYTLGEGYALQHLGVTNALMGKRQEAAVFLNRADAIARKIGDQELGAYVLLRMGQNYQGNDNKKALQYELQAVETAQKTGDKALLSLCQRRLAGLYQISLSD